ncbi:putative large exoprotein involved in heme utilization or adhesion of ShlA/HecA/FhaA family [Candidatus Paraburkholderia schumanniana]|nr:putative large exoprotein involved in heme utilization or adhesion of ShlA/HecA/FhaA family [Candidatus Paraburkholderia schumannianae]
MTAVQDLTTLATQTLTNSGTLAANGNAAASAGATLTNSGSLAAGRTVSASAATLDNSGGTINGEQLSIATANRISSIVTAASRRPARAQRPWPSQARSTTRAVRLRPTRRT